jgi:hypothetical protein
VVLQLALQQRCGAGCWHDNARGCNVAALQLVLVQRCGVVALRAWLQRCSAATADGYGALGRRLCCSAAMVPGAIEIFVFFLFGSFCTRKRERKKKEVKRKRALKPSQLLVLLVQS